ncbi:unnamed protein product [Polarella glacialis]|uniref:Uncharacterized protein n=1 Tax=Polarella glacialis TaxID=89957 RepID=A0A813EP03_POLGL|nr:unnamed protein product [Polarella glacialis]
MWRSLTAASRPTTCVCRGVQQAQKRRQGGGRSTRRPSPEDGHHNAFSWLAEGFTVTASPHGRLLPGLHALDLQDWMLLEVGARAHLEAKRAAFADAELRPQFLRLLPGSEAAQREVLDMLLAHLPKRYPDAYAVTAPALPPPSDNAARGSEASSASAPPPPHFPPESRVRVTTGGLDVDYVVGDFERSPLELASLLVQEDLGILQNGVLTAASVLFSFGSLPQRIGKPMEEIHARVPQYEADLHRPVSRVFQRVTPEKPLWRTNWNLSWSDSLLVSTSRYPHRNPGISDEERAVVLAGFRTVVAEKGLAHACWLKVEYQTLR